MIEYSKEGDMHVVTMNNDDNAICMDWQTRMLEILEVIEADCAKGASLVMAGEGKFFSNGLNLPVLMKMPQERWPEFSSRMAEIHSRMLLLPCPTVAAVNGHAFAGGAFLALSLDYRIMREDLCWISISEVYAGVPIPDPMMGILRCTVPPATARDAILTGKRYTADEALAAGLIDGKASESELLQAAKGLATQLATKEPEIFKTIKQTYFGDMAAAIAAQ
jgi:enoyl-CoA hydratase/carnithine racemase